MPCSFYIQSRLDKGPSKHRQLSWPKQNRNYLEMIAVSIEKGLRV